MLASFPIGRDNVPNCLIAVVLTSLPEKVTHICQKEYGSLFRSGHLNYFTGCCLKSRTGSIYWGKGTDKRKAVLLDSSTQLTDVHQFVAIIISRSPCHRGLP